MLAQNVLAQNYAAMRERIGSLSAPAPPPALLAVSKGQPAEAIAVLHGFGQVDFGENYVDELEAKALALAHLPLRWHFIGQLQSNKIARIVRIAAAVHTVASEKHVRYLDRLVAELHRPRLPIYIQVNAGNEVQKAGVPIAVAQNLASLIDRNFPNLLVEGIMAIPPSDFQDTDYPDQPPELFENLRRAASAVGRGGLSLGMSGDLRIAIKAGSTLVRIGSALFGERRPPTAAPTSL